MSPQEQHTPQILIKLWIRGGNLGKDYLNLNLELEFICCILFSVIYLFFQRIIALFLFILFLPLLGVFYIIVWLDSGGPFLFKQKRMGKKNKPFWMYKIRTMVQEAESIKLKVQRLNEADGPVFKIQNDPRHTRIGRFLSHSALDEVPQLINVIRGEMAFVGPRPLPVSEARNVPKRYEIRFSVLPGMTSTWVVQGAHELSFQKWMELDCEYAKKRTIMGDISILLKTVFIVAKMMYMK